MNWNLKEEYLTSGWKNFFRKMFSPLRQRETSQQHSVHAISAGPALLNLVIQPQAQRIFAGLHNYLSTKNTKNTPGIILVCTANPGEGASSVALGLAAAAARDQRDKILLIDGNFYHPCLCQAWSLPDNLGFFDLISGLSNNLDLPQKTRLGNLWVLGAGSSVESHSRDLEPRHLQEIFAALADQYTMVIIDGPPLNTQPESNLYGLYAKQVLLVVAAGLSRAPVVSNAIAKFPVQVRDKLEVVLNRRIYPIPETLYRKLWTS